MTYAALAAVIGIVGLAAVYAAWDFGRRWLRSHERAQEAALIRASTHYVSKDDYRDEVADIRAMINDLDDVAGDRKVELDKVREAYGDSQTALNLKVRELSDRMDHVVDWGTASVAGDEALRARVSALEQRPAESPDLTDVKAQLELHAKALENFWNTIGKQFVPREEFAAEFNKLKTATTAVGATNTTRWTGART